MMKKHILTAMVVCLLAMALPVSALASSTFADVPASAYYQDAVSWAVEQGITTGTSATTFSPESTCTRAQILTFLWRAAGSPQPRELSGEFTDVKETDYFYEAACWAAEKGILTPEGDRFAPNTPCTRAATVEYLWRYAGSPADAFGAAFTDVPSGTGLERAVSWAVNEGVTNGTSATTFSPEKTCTRGQIVTFLHRAFADGDARSDASANVPASDLEGKKSSVTYVDAEDPDNLFPDNLGNMSYDLYGASEGTVIRHSDLQMSSNNPSDNVDNFFEAMWNIASVEREGNKATLYGHNCGYYKVNGNGYELQFDGWGAMFGTKEGRNVYLNALVYFAGEDLGTSIWCMMDEFYRFRKAENVPITDELAAKYGLTIENLSVTGVIMNISNGMDTVKIQYEFWHPMSGQSVTIWVEA